MTGKLVDILTGSAAPREMGTLALGYALTILVVQGNRYFKRFYVRRFANNVSRRMKQVLYAKLVARSRVSLIAEGEGSIMTKAIGDVDDCVEGMRKFTTELFDTGVALLAYCGMLLHYDWPGNIRELRNMMERLALFLSVEPTPDLTPQFLQLLLPELARESSKTPAPRLLTPQQALEKFNGDKTAAANYLGISRTTFWRRLKS